jgi:phage host-nuclease inhibitor protein Gam
MYLYFGIKFDGTRWNIATALLSSRAKIASCIRTQKEIDKESVWAIGSCKRSEIEAVKE